MRRSIKLLNATSPLFSIPPATLPSSRSSRHPAFNGRPPNRQRRPKVASHSHRPVVTQLPEPNRRSPPRRRVWLKPETRATWPRHRWPRRCSQDRARRKPMRGWCSKPDPLSEPPRRASRRRAPPTTWRAHALGRGRPQDLMHLASAGRKPRRMPLWETPKSPLARPMNMAVRARRVGEGMASMRANAARRAAAGGGGGVATGGTPATLGGGVPAPAGGPAPAAGPAPAVGGAPVTTGPAPGGGPGSPTPTPPAAAAPLTSAALPTEDDLDARLDALEAHGTDEPHTMVRTPAKNLRDVQFTEGGSQIQAGNIKGATIHEGPVPLEGPAAAPARQAPAPPETWLLDPARANMTDPDEIADAQFRPNRTGHQNDVRNVQVTAGPAGDKIATPGGPTFGEDRVVGGARGAALDPTSGTWKPGEAPYQRPYNPLGQGGGPFTEQGAADWHKWEQSHGPLDEAQRYALWFYSDDLSGHLNPALRGERPGQFVTDPVAREAVASDLDKTMKPVPVDTVVHRKASVADFADLGVTDPAQLPTMTGKSYSHAGYTSTAIQAGKWSGDIDIVIQVPKGTRGRYMGGEQRALLRRIPVRPAPGAPTASMPGEMEFLVERGTSFKIEKAEFDQATGRWRVDVRIAEQGVKPALSNPVPLPGSPAPPGGGAAAAPAGPAPATNAPPASPAAAQPAANKPAETVPPPVESADDIRARRVAEGLADMKARTEVRAERIKVQPIDDPDEAARLFVEGKGGAGGNSHMSRKTYESQWRYFHHQLTDPPAAGWRRADGTVVVDASNSEGSRGDRAPGQRTQGKRRPYGRPGSNAAACRGRDRRGRH